MRQEEHACQWGSNTGREASQPAVAACLPVRGPQPSCGSMLNAHDAEGTVEGRSPDAPASSATIWPAKRSGTWALDVCRKGGERQRAQKFCMRACKQAMQAVLGLAGCRRTLMPGGAGLEAFLDIPQESVLQADSNALAERA